MNTNESIGVAYLAARKGAMAAWAAGQEYNGVVTYITIEFGVVDFAADGSGQIDSEVHGFLIPADASKLTLTAARLIRDAYRQHGRHTIECAACGREAVVDADASTADVAVVADLIEHTAFDHVSRAELLSVVHVVSLRTTDVYPV